MSNLVRSGDWIYDQARLGCKWAISDVARVGLFDFSGLTNTIGGSDKVYGIVIVPSAYGIPTWAVLSIYGPRPRSPRVLNVFLNDICNTYDAARWAAGSILKAKVRNGYRIITDGERNPTYGFSTTLNLIKAGKYRLANKIMEGSPNESTVLTSAPVAKVSERSAPKPQEEQKPVHAGRSARYERELNI